MRVRLVRINLRSLLQLAVLGVILYQVRPWRELAVAALCLVVSVCKHAGVPWIWRHADTLALKCA